MRAKKDYPIICKYCNQVFYTWPCKATTAKYCNKECKQLASWKGGKFAAIHRRNKTEKYKQAQIRYQKTEKYRQKLVRAIQNHRAKKYGISQLSKEIYRELILNSKMICIFCDTKLSTRNSKYAPNHLTIEHLVPITRGGTNDITNLRISCRQCNIEKQNRLIHEWY